MRDESRRSRRSSSFFFLALLLSAPLLSCASIAPLTPGDFPLRAAAPGDLAPRWAAFVPGIDYLEARIGTPRLQLWALRVDLGNPDLEFVVNGSDGPGGESPTAADRQAAAFGIIPSTTVSGFVRDYGCVAGINANPFDRVSARTGEPRTIVGIALGSGVLIAAPDPRYDALILRRDGSAAIVSQDGLDEAALAKIRHAVGGFSAVLRDGSPAERLRNEDGKAPRHPRSAVGLSGDGTTLYLLAIDGRRAGSVGATEGELALILRRLGAEEGLNFDGGGSTALALRYPDGRIRPANTPIHGLIPGKERAVAVCLGIRAAPAGK